MESSNEPIANFDPDEIQDWLSLLDKSKLSFKNIIAGINEDDCAIVKVGQEHIVITTDFLNANPIAIEFGIGGYYDLGRILVAANISDLCGTGAYPIGFLNSVMFKQAVDAEPNFKLFMEGVNYELNKLRIPLIGGDTKLGDSNVFCGIAIGIKRKGTKLFMKNAAKVNDSIWLSGSIGGVAAAIDGLKSNTMNQKWNNWAKSKIIEPLVPLRKSKILAKARLANGGTDISDGLCADLWDLCRASKIGALIEVESIPVENKTKEIAALKGILPWIYSLTIGGDFQFLFTSSPKNDLTLKKMGFAKIGNTIAEKQTYIKNKDEIFIMPKNGHRDKEKTSFYDEIQQLNENILKSISHDKKG